MKKALLSIALLTLSTMAFANDVDKYRISHETHVFSDPSAKYKIVYLKKVDDNQVVFMTTRDGKSGKSKEARVVNCRVKAYRYATNDVWVPYSYSNRHISSELSMVACSLAKFN